MALRASFSRSFLAAARSATSRSASAAPRVRPPQPAGLRPPRRSFTSSPPRLFRALGCAQSLLPLHSVVAGQSLTSYLSVEARACCELSQGT
ncbi:hypothetical protein H6P81_020467 [Aristolochia fimbriata]|uniref:Uncharacterized protein n=1 Tax=Aristolochia fimbriata TaxID=158543 RepID=A0AAV7DUI6_ARIFI|nr:hypothetical protein H6P81_020467 [Aristolochia fimbriata]